MLNSGSRQVADKAKCVSAYIKTKRGHARRTLHCCLGFRAEDEETEQPSFRLNLLARAVASYFCSLPSRHIFALLHFSLCFRRVRSVATAAPCSFSRCDTSSSAWPWRWHSSATTLPHLLVRWSELPTSEARTRSMANPNRGRRKKPEAPAVNSRGRTRTTKKVAESEKKWPNADDDEGTEPKRNERKDAR